MIHKKLLIECIVSPFFEPLHACVWLWTLLPTRHFTGVGFLFRRLGCARHTSDGKERTNVTDGRPPLTGNGVILPFFRARPRQG
jgi:hypothetical protein